MKLTDNFELEELVVSVTAKQLGIDNTPPAPVAANLQRLAQLVLQPLREHVGRPVVVKSGYRSEHLNRVVGGVQGSDHITGCAADIVVPGMKARDVCMTIIAMRLGYKQVILEGHAWTHVSVPAIGELPKREQLTAVFGPGGAQYLQGIS